MKPHDLKAARLRKGWVQVQVAEYLGVTQAYVNMLKTEEDGLHLHSVGVLLRYTAFRPKRCLFQKNLCQPARITSTWPSLWRNSDIQVLLTCARVYSRKIRQRFC